MLNIWIDAAIGIVGYTVSVFAGGAVVGWIIKRMEVPRGVVEGGLPNAGRYIGWVERFLITTLVLNGEIGAVGFIVAAKSILRLGEIKDVENRILAEYILLGTFLSVSIAICAGLAIHFLVQRF